MSRFREKCQDPYRVVVPARRSGHQQRAAFGKIRTVSHWARPSDWSQTASRIPLRPQTRIGHRAPPLALDGALEPGPRAQARIFPDPISTKGDPTSRHHGWRAPPEAIFFRARPLATIQTLPKWPKTCGLELAQNRPFLAGHLFFPPFIVFFLGLFCGVIIGGFSFCGL